MAIEIRWRRGTTAQHATFTGAVSEVTVDTDKKTVVVHDGAQAGGFPLQREDANLNSLSTLGTVADRVAYTTAEDTWAETPLTAFARTLLDDTTAEAARATLGTASGSEVITATITPATDADVTLTEAQYSADVLIIETGAWVAARNIIVPNESRSWQVFSNSAYAATVKTAAGSGVVVAAGQSRQVLCNGTDVVSIRSDVGTVVYHAANALLHGYLKANGAEVSRTTYAALFSVIGTAYGAGDGATTFALPDLRGEFLRGFDDGRGADSGRGFGSAQLDQMQRITGQWTPRNDYTIGATGAFSIGGVVAGQRQEGANNVRQVDFDSANSPNARVSSTTDGETRPRNIAMLACIKY